MQAAWKNFAQGLQGMLLMLLFASYSGAAPDSIRKVDFAKDIQPILEKNCFECHGPEKQKSGLRLDRKADALKGGDNGALLVAGNSAKSLIIQAVEGTHAEIGRMPKKRDPLPATQIALLRAWIDQDAEWPDSRPQTPGSGLKHWAFKPPVRPAIPPVKGKS